MMRSHPITFRQGSRAFGVSSMEACLVILLWLLSRMAFGAEPAIANIRATGEVDAISKVSFGALEPGNGSMKWLLNYLLPVVILLLIVSFAYVWTLRLKRNLKHSVSLLDAALESTADGIVVVDQNRRSTHFNKKFVELWRIPPELAAARDDDTMMNFIAAQLINPEAFLTTARRLYDQPESTDFDVLRFKDGRCYERFSKPQRVDGQTVGRVWSFRDATERNRVEIALRQSLLEKETLLREVHHRVKNNLQIISSLLHFQAKKAAHEEEILIFREGQDRLRAMILVHDQLYRSEDLRSINLGEYVRALVEHLGRSFHEGNGRVELDLAVEELLVPTEIALPCGMVVTELVTNAFKYAYPSGVRGPVQVRIARNGSRFVLSVADSGVGLPAGFDLWHARSFGLNLVANLTAQLGAELTTKSDHGTLISLQVPLPNRPAAMDRLSASEYEPTGEPRPL